MRHFRWILHPLVWVWDKLDSNTLRKIRDLFMIGAAISLVWVLLTMLDLQESSKQRGLENRRTFDDIQSIVKVVEEIVRDVRDQNSPETSKEQQELLELVLRRIDCKQQASNQQVIIALEARGVLEPGETRAITEECEKFLREEGQ